jgi:hypothetical protein
MKPPLLVGGVDLVRWATQAEFCRGNPEPADYELAVATIARMSEPVIDWWFKRVRCLDFDDNAAIERIFAASSGIPLIVAAIDGALTKDEAEHITQARLGSALSTVESQLADLAHSLRSGPTSSRLEPRELELLKMFALVAPTFSAADEQRAALAELWEDYAQVKSWAPLREDEPKDVQALAVLQRVGLLPVQRNAASRLPFDRLAPVLADDRLLALVDALDKST